MARSKIKKPLPPRAPVLSKRLHSKKDRRIRNRGVISHQPHGSDFVAGMVSGIPSDLINAYGDWRPWLPTYERQATKIFDSMACVSFSALNCLETIHEFRYGTKVNYSDRFLAKMSNTQRWGNSLRAVGDTIRNTGLVDEGLWTWEPMMTWETYYVDVPVDVQAEAQEFKDDYEVGYEFITDVSGENLRKELRKGPLQVTIGSNDIESHAVELVFVDDEGWKWIFDHYGNGLTRLVPERRIFTALRYHYIKKRESNTIPSMIEIPENALVFMAEPPGLYGLHVGGKIYVDELPKITAQWISRNEKNGVFSGGPMKSVYKMDWDKFPKFTLKNEQIQ